MADILNENGLQIESLNDTISKLNTAFTIIYGADVNLDSNSPDGQIIAIAGQIGRDNREYAMAVYNSFDLRKCTGIILDIRCALIGIIRKGGSYTQIPVNITVDRAVTLSGLDSNYNNANATSYTVQDSAGNKFYLVDTTTLTVGTTELTFRAKDIGFNTIATDTVNQQSTIILGVTAVNNDSGALQIGEDQETDSELRLRAERSPSINSQGYLNGLEAKLLNLAGVTEAKVYENDTATDDFYGDGIAKNSIWAIVEGGSNEDIANIIYACKSPGCNMRGSVSETITTISGVDRTIKFDRSTSEDLYIKFDLKPTVSGIVFNQDAIKAYIETNLIYSLNEFAETSKVNNIAVDAINNSSGNAVPLNVQIGLLNSTGGIDWGTYYTPTAKNYQFTVSVSHITITEV